MLRLARGGDYKPVPAPCDHKHGGGKEAFWGVMLLSYCLEFENSQLIDFVLFRFIIRYLWFVLYASLKRIVFFRTVTLSLTVHKWATFKA